MEQTGSATQGSTVDLTRIRDLVGHLYRTVKTILLYPPTNPLPGEFRQQLFNKISSFTEEMGPFTLQVRGNQFLFEGETVHEDAGGEDNFIATLTRDGVQRLTFLPTMLSEELDSFLEIFKKVINDRNENDDLVTMLWEAGFEGIRYEAISELDTVDYEAIEKRLLGEEPPDATDRLDFASVILDENAEDDPAAGPESAAPDTPADSKPISGIDITAIIGDVTDISDDVTQVDQYLREANQFDSEKSTISIVFEILIGENEIPEFRESCTIADNLYDRFIEQGNFAASLRIVEGLIELEQTERDHSPARTERLKESRLRTADRVRIEQMTRALNAHPGCDIESCRALLAILPLETLPHLVNALADLEHYPARKAVCDVLAERGADRIDSIGNGVFDKRWYVVRNVAVVLGNIGGPRACTYLEKILRHDDQRVRKEVVEALVRIDPRDSSRLLRSILEDPEYDLRMLALKALSRRRDQDTAVLIEQVVSNGAFRRREPSEQKEWLFALARIQGEQALPLLRKLVGRWAIFDRANQQRLQALAVIALGEAGGEDTVQYLEKLKRHRNVRVREAAIRALARLHEGPTQA